MWSIARTHRANGTRPCRRKRARSLIIERLESRQLLTTLDFDFASGDFGWVAGFADYPPADAGIYDLVADHRARPPEVGTGAALYISGDNHSDDLFMYWKKPATGFQPETDYHITFAIEFASKYPTGMVGVGGAPGDGVALKAGAVGWEPAAFPDESGWLRMNLDKDSGGNPVGGVNMRTLGSIAKPEDGNFDYVLVSRSSSAATPFTARSSSDGTLWFIFGTDSGFEATTSLYYTHVTVTATAQTPEGPAWQNPRHPCDITDDAKITPVDVLTLINDINAHGSRDLTGASPPTPAPPPFLDPSGDNGLSPVDVLVVINYINSHGSGPIPGTFSGSAATGEGVPAGEGEAGLGTQGNPLVAAPGAVADRPKVASHGDVESRQGIPVGTRLVLRQPDAPRPTRESVPDPADSHDVVWRETQRRTEADELAAEWLRWESEQQ
jgi:hypothetical protein